MTTVEIQVVANGYLARHFDTMDRARGIAAEAPHVFPTFEALVGWLQLNLEKPYDPKTNTSS